MDHTQKCHELVALNTEKEKLDAALTELNIRIRHCEQELLEAMAQAELEKFTDKETGLTFKIEEGYEAKQTEYAKIYAEEAAEIFKEKGFNIYKTAVHWGTFQSTVKKEIAKVDEETKEIILPDWAKEFVEITFYHRVKIL